jgi:hypothetical protein
LKPSTYLNFNKKELDRNTVIANYAAAVADGKKYHMVNY